jgi:beta-N-acetylhexosaminidase
MIDLKGKPFYLTGEDIQWVEKTLAGMDLETKVGQLFCPIGLTSDENVLTEVVTKFKPAGMMFRPGAGADVQRTHRFLQSLSQIPMLFAANLETGGTGIASDGTLYGTQMQVAATDDVNSAYTLGLIAGREGRAVGCNWAFAPVIDIDYNFRNPITNTRTYGSDPKRVLRMGRGYMKGIHESGLAVSIKHFPGDGVDERDQHLLTTINSLSPEEWDKSYGMIYKALIDEGAQTVMIGHIMLPEYQKKLRPELKDEEIMPATLAPELLQTLLRGKLGFNGMIVTDATSMAGFTMAMKREDAVPYSIAAGCDMFLFNLDYAEDYEFMIKGIERGILSMERVDEALTRILALKAALKLHEQKENGTLVPGEEALSVLRCEEHETWAKECADKAITLVKNKEDLLPISPANYRRVLLHVLGDTSVPGSHSGGGALNEKFKELLEKEGFEVTKFDIAAYDPAKAKKAVRIMKENYDLIIYYANIGTYSNQTVTRITWAPPMGINIPKYMQEIPTMFISVAGPYHLQDVSRIKTFINAYTSSSDIVEALVEKLVGRSEFKGRSPVDAFCGMFDTRL